MLHLKHTAWYGAETWAPWKIVQKYTLKVWKCGTREGSRRSGRLIV
jgi:hypothetical protein